MKKSYRFWSYTCMVWKLAAEEFCMLYRTDWRIWLGNIASVVLALLALRYLGGENAMANELMVILSGAIGAIGGGVVMFLLTVIYVPAKLFRDKEQEADKFTWNDISIGIDKNTQSNPDGACLHIHSHKPLSIQRARVQILNIMAGSVSIYREEFPAFVPWVGHKGYSPAKTLHFNTERKVSLANWNKDGGWINTVDQDRIEKKLVLEKDVYYKVTLRWRGEIDGRSSDWLEEIYSIRYTGKNIELNKEPTQ